MYLEKKENKFFAFLIFLIWPFLSVALAIRNYRASWAKNIIWLFVAFFGYTMVISEGIDSYTYRSKFTQSANSTQEERKISIYESGEKDSIDFIEPIISTIVSSFTSNARILFAVYGLIFGFFYSRNIWILLDKINSPINIILIILIFTFVLINPFWNINGFRYNTAAQVFVYGMLLYFVEGNKKGVWFILITFTIHFSFLIAIFIFAIYFILGNRITLYFYFFVTSLFIEGLQLDTVRENLIFLPEIFQERTSSYVNDEYAEAIANTYETANWYLKGHKNALHYAISALLIFIFWKGKSLLRREKLHYAYFSFILLFYGFANFMSSIPSGGRFMSPASSMAISLILIISVSDNFRSKWLIDILKVTSFFFVVFIVVVIRIGFDVIGISSVFGNPLFSTFMRFRYTTNPIIKIIFFKIALKAKNKLLNSFNK